MTKMSKQHYFVFLLKIKTLNKVSLHFKLLRLLTKALKNFCPTLSVGGHFEEETNFKVEIQISW